MKLNMKPLKDFKCKFCGKGESKHRSKDKACVIGGTTNLPTWHESQSFESSGKLTIASKRKIETYEKAEAARILREEAFKREQSKVRAMTFNEVIIAAVELLTEETGLGIIVEQEYEYCMKIIMTCPKRHSNGKAAIRLGYTTATKHSDGRYSVGGTNSGCFMSNSSDLDISNIMAPLFRDLEERANKEKA